MPLHRSPELAFVPAAGDIIQDNPRNVDIRLEVLVTHNHGCDAVGHPGGVDDQDDRQL